MLPNDREYPYLADIVLGVREKREGARFGSAIEFHARRSGSFSRDIGCVVLWV